MRPAHVVPRVAALEARVRRAWTGRPGPGLRAAGCVFAVAADARRFLYEAGVLETRRAPIPLVSVGGLTVGGSGKTPVAAELARWLHEQGRRPAVLTRGHSDELGVHRRLLPGVTVLGHPRPLRAVAEAAARGAGCAVLDDGFAHRGLARELDLLLIDADALARTNRRRLPAGPFRHGPDATSLAHALVVTRRAPEGATARRTADRLVRRPGGRPVGLCSLRPGPARPANLAARRAGVPDPRVAVTGIMKPRLFERDARRRWPGLERVHSFRDHRGPRGRRLDEIVGAAGERGILCTLKDAVRLAPLVGEATPIWYVVDVIEWERGASEIRELLLERTAAPRNR